MNLNQLFQKYQKGATSKAYFPQASPLIPIRNWLEWLTCGVWLSAWFKKKRGTMPRLRRWWLAGVEGWGGPRTSGGDADDQEGAARTSGVVNGGRTASGASPPAAVAAALQTNLRPGPSSAGFLRACAPCEEGGDVWSEL